MALNAPTVAALLNFFPLGGVFTTLTLKMQVSPHRRPRDSFAGVFPELWYGDQTNQPKRWMPIGSAQFYLLLFQACEGPLPAIVSDFIYRSLYGISPKQQDTKRKPLPASEEVLQQPLISKPTISYLIIRPAVYTVFSLLSHPFSIVRTYYLVRADVPPTTTSYFSRTLSDGIYQRSYTAHLLSGVSEIWATHLFVRFFTWCKNVYLPSPSTQTPIAVTASGKGKRSPMNAMVREFRMKQLHEMFAQNIVRTLAAFATRTVLYPIFTIRARLEGEWTHDEGRHEGLVDCFSSIVREEGISGLYRGLPSHLVSFGMQSIYIALLYALAKGFIQADLWEDEEPDNGQASPSPLTSKQI